MNTLDILLALPLVAAVWVLLSRGTFLFSLIKVVLALGLLLAALVFIDFPPKWTEGSLLYGPLRSAVDFVMKICGAL
jgi:dipeptide/tripeptide permease